MFLFKCGIFLIFLQMAILSAAPFSVTQRVGPTKQDISQVSEDELLQFLKGTQEEKTKIILVPGLFNNIVLNLNKSPIWSNFVTYLTKKGLKKSKSLSDAKGDFFILNYNTQAGPETTVPVLLKSFRSLIYPKGEKTLHPQKLIIVGHSKGSLDSMLALFSDKDNTNNLPILPHLKATLLLSTPWEGTPIADTFYKYPFLKFTMVGVLESFKGNAACLKYLRSSERAIFNKRSDVQEFLENFLLEIPTLSVGSALDKNNLSSISFLKYSIPLKFYEKLSTKKSDVLTDGAILTTSSYAMGGDYIVLKGPSHQDMIMNEALSPFIEEFFKTLAFKYDIYSKSSINNRVDFLN